MELGLKTRECVRVRVVREHDPEASGPMKRNRPTCEHPDGCEKTVADFATKRCAAHGPRCQHPGGCTKAAKGNLKLCIEHGGGNRCEHPECTKSAIGATKRCSPLT